MVFEREGGGTWEKEWESEREEKPILILKSIYFSQSIHSPFMPQVKFIYNVYNTKRDSISIIFDVQIWE